MGPFYGSKMPLNSRTAKLVVCAQVLALSFLISPLLKAQAVDGTLSGTITGPSGDAVPNAKVSIKNVATSQSTDAQTDAAGHYTAPNLAPGEYGVSASAEGFSPQSAHATLAAGGQQTLGEG
jgi:hypothetical protein